MPTSLLLTSKTSYANSVPIIDGNSFTIGYGSFETKLYFDYAGYQFDYSLPNSTSLSYCDLSGNCSSISGSSGTYTVPYAGYLKMSNSASTIKNIITVNKEAVTINLKVLAPTYYVKNNCTYYNGNTPYVTSCTNEYNSGDTAQGSVYLLFDNKGQKYQVKIDNNDWKDVTNGPNHQQYLLSETGTHTIVARTVVSTGVYSEETEPFTITIKSNPPTINTFTATSGTVTNYNTTSMTLTATATSESTISKYEFYQGNTLIKTINTSANSASTQVTSFSNSNANYTVKVYDVNGSVSSKQIIESCSATTNITACSNGSHTMQYTCTGTGRNYSATTSYGCYSGCNLDISNGKYSCDGGNTTGFCSISSSDKGTVSTPTGSCRVTYYECTLFKGKVISTSRCY